MSSIYYLISSHDCRLSRCSGATRTTLETLSAADRGHAVVNNGRCETSGLGSISGGETGERHDTTSGVDRGGVVHPNPDAVFASLFIGESGFFLAADTVQVKYEMLRARLVDPDLALDAAIRVFA